MRAGELYEIRSGNRRAMVTEQGATLARVIWDGAEIVSTPHPDGFAGPGCNGQLLVPWPGRISDGTYEHDGERYHLAIDDPFHHAAIHGLARWLAWQPSDRSAGKITLHCRMLGTPGYPFPFELEQSYAWGKECLEISFGARNIGSRSAPFGYGCHPYFSVGSATVDDDVLQVPASQYFAAGDDLAPEQPALAVGGTAFDFREPRPIGRTELDVTLASLDRDEDGKVTVNFRSPDAAISITCKYDEPVRFLQLYSGDTLPTDRRSALAIEPYTCAPNAFNNGLGLERVPPGGSLKVHWTLGA